MSVDHTPPTGELPPAREVSAAHYRGLLRQMLRVRRFEETCAELYSAQKIRGFLHLYIGEEAVAVGALSALSDDDPVLCTYREHGHALVRGVDAGAVMAEMFGKQEGCSRGRGGSMHLFDAERRFYGGNAIVGGHLPPAVGMALADQLAGRHRVTAVFFGEGASAEGEFHEALNLAALWKAPVLFVCENNLYAMGTALERSEANVHLTDKARALGVPAEEVDGMDVLAVEAAVAKAAAAVRGGDGPRLLEVRTYRFRAHSMFDAELYRDKEEVKAWQARDPIRLAIDAGKRDGLVTDAEIEAIEQSVGEEIAAAVAFAEAGTWEPVEELLVDVTTPRPASTPLPSYHPEQADGWDGPRVVTCREALKLALREAMHSDERVLLMGEDVGRYGGSYAVSKGLLAEFGEERIRDTPLAESGFTGVGVGLALGDRRPIVEIMTVNFSLLALDQIVNNAATLRHMSGGQLSVPLVVRMATGAGRQLAAQHSHSLENWYAHVPGLRVVAPSCVQDFRGMLWTALQDLDPVVMVEHAGLYNLEGELDPNQGPLDLDKAAIRRPGTDVTLITYGGSLPKTLEAAERLAAAGVSAEVLDLRTLRPLDDATILGSVLRTRRCVIVDEGWRTGSLSGEIAARVGAEAFWDLEAPIERVCTAEVPIPYAKHLEEAALPQVPAIVRAACRTLGLDADEVLRG
ncbi:MAG: pyruvate dehydrogenase (acetyl-transferring) E1 component subunit alpha [Alphaproteobacteria bacterium]|nr:pyruvate dehydrogenase (acetyl-transferring) E1 component subunit alpha [Alphaproteobacteria bacterium]